MDVRVTAGSPEPLGVTPDDAGANVAVFSAQATAMAFCLFARAGERETARVLRPGSPLIITFSNRFFPTKAVAWRR